MDSVEEALAEALCFVRETNDVAPPPIERRAILYVRIQEAAKVLLDLFLKLFYEHNKVSLPVSEKIHLLRLEVLLSVVLEDIGPFQHFVAEHDCEERIAHEFYLTGRVLLILAQPLLLDHQLRQAFEPEFDGALMI